MSTAIHIELNALCLLILCVITFQSVHNINQQMRRILFRSVVIGVMCELVLDILWLLVEGRGFPGAIAANRVINALFLAAGVILGGVWYLYVLETLGYTITKRLQAIVLLPGALFTLINVASIWTEWIFTVSPENVYAHGPLFWLQMIGAYGMMLIPMVHIVIRMLNRNARVPRRTVQKLLGFYIVPIVGGVVSVFYTGMPGTWTCAAVSIALIYIEDQDSQIVRDGLTGLNNRRMLEPTFGEYVKQASPTHGIYLFMMDLDRFKQINDTHGHITGDEALVAAARLLSAAMVGKKGLLARYGGDEFLAMLFFAGDDEAARFAADIKASFAAYNRDNRLPYHLTVSVGMARYHEGQALEALVKAADDALYRDKKRG